MLPEVVIDMNVKQRVCSWLNVKRQGITLPARHGRPVRVPGRVLLYCCKFSKSVACGSKHRVQESACQHCARPFTGKDVPVYEPGIERRLADSRERIDRDVLIQEG